MNNLRVTKNHTFKKINKLIKNRQSLNNSVVT